MTPSSGPRKAPRITAMRSYLSLCPSTRSPFTAANRRWIYFTSPTTGAQLTAAAVQRRWRHRGSGGSGKLAAPNEVTRGTVRSSQGGNRPRTPRPTGRHTPGMRTFASSGICATVQGATVRARLFSSVRSHLVGSETGMSEQFEPEEPVWYTTQVSLRSYAGNTRGSNRSRSRSRTEVSNNAASIPAPAAALLFFFFGALVVGHNPWATTTRRAQSVGRCRSAVPAASARRSIVDLSNTQSLPYPHAFSVHPPSKFGLHWR